MKTSSTSIFAAACVAAASAAQALPHSPSANSRDERFSFGLALLGLNVTRGEVRDHWNHPVEHGCVWKF